MKSINRELWWLSAAIVTIFLFAVAVAGTASANPGTTYYVNATGGDDGNTGLSEAQAWKTITHAVATVPAGASAADPNIITVSAGLYDATTNGETFPITFNNGSISLIGAGAAITTIDSEDATTILDINATGITIEGFTITNGTKGIFSDDFGGFSILDNTFTDVSEGVHLNIDAANLATNYTVDDIRIRNNTFNVSVDGVYFYIDLDYHYMTTGWTVSIGDIDILNNVFNMVTTVGVDIENIKVQELNGGSIAVGEVNISGNEFYGGDYGIDFSLDFYLDESFYDLTNTTVTAGDVVMNNNIFENQSSKAMDIDYYDATEWYGTTSGTFGDLVINNNTIMSVTTDAIHIDDADFHQFHDDAALTAGNLYLEDNEINVSGTGISLRYNYANYLFDNASIAIGELFIKENRIVSRADYGIDLWYSDFGCEMYNNSKVTTGAVHIDENTINAHDDVIEVYYEEDVACKMGENASIAMGDVSVQDNNISGDDEGIYIVYPCWDEGYDWWGLVGYEMFDNASAELPDYVITGNTFNVTGDGICLDTCFNPSSLFDDARFDFGGFFIDDNTFSCEDGIELWYDAFCAGAYDNSASIIGDVTITNNRFYDVDDEAISIYYDDIGYYYDYFYSGLCENSTLEVGDLLIADNVIDNVTGYDGIDVEYWTVYSYDDSHVTMGMLDILRNEISNVQEDGIDIDYVQEVYGDSIQTIGRALIQGNTIDACGEAGIDLYMSLYNESGTTVNLGNPLIAGNNISNCGDGVEFEDVEYATIRRNMIVNNTGLPESGVDLNSGSAYNQIYENCFYNNRPFQAVDNGINNLFYRNFWDDWDGSGPYEIYGIANNSDANPLDECQQGEEPPAPAKAPALMPLGLIALISLLSAIAAVAIVRKRC